MQGFCEVDPFIQGQLTHIDLNSPSNFDTVVPASATPEPATFSLVGMIVTGVFFARRRRI